MKKTYIKNIEIKKLRDTPVEQEFGIHLKLRKETTGLKTANSEGMITYILSENKALISTWGRFPNVDFWLPDFENFLFREDGLDDLKKLILVYIEKEREDATREFNADCMQDEAACRRAEERDGMDNPPFKST